jgi:F0F1-type ATP synthase membrane subunit b/b'
MPTATKPGPATDQGAAMSIRTHIANTRAQKRQHLANTRAEKRQGLANMRAQKGQDLAAWHRRVRDTLHLG